MPLYCKTIWFLFAKVYIYNNIGYLQIFHFITITNKRICIKKNSNCLRHVRVTRLLWSFTKCNFNINISFSSSCVDELKIHWLILETNHYTHREKLNIYSEQEITSLNVQEHARMILIVRSGRVVWNQEQPCRSVQVWY